MGKRPTNGQKEQKHKKSKKQRKRELSSGDASPLGAAATLAKESTRCQPPFVYCPKKTLQLCEGCQANSQDTEFAWSTSRPKSVPRQFFSCWTVWMPTSLVLTWVEFTHKLRSDNEIKERVDMALKHMNELGGGYRGSFPEAVKTSDDLAVRIIRRGRLFSPKDVPFDGQLFTPSQLSLKECNMKLSTLFRCFKRRFSGNIERVRISMCR